MLITEIPLICSGYTISRTINNCLAVVLNLVSLSHFNPETVTCSPLDYVDGTLLIVDVVITMSKVILSADWLGPFINVEVS